MSKVDKVGGRPVWSHDDKDSHGSLLSHEGEGSTMMSYLRHVTVMWSHVIVM